MSASMAARSVQAGTRMNDTSPVKGRFSRASAIVVAPVRVDRPSGAPIVSSSRRPMPRTVPDRRGAGAGPDADRAVTLLLALRDPGSGDALRRLARRLAARLGHAVEPCLLDGPGDPLAGALERAVERGARRLVALPLALGLAGDAAGRLGTLLARVAQRWPGLRVHRGEPPDPDDLARILGDRARAAAGARGGGPSLGDMAVVIAGGDGANPVANAELARLARLVYEAHRFADVGCAFVDLTAPTVGDAIGRWVRLGARRIVVVPHLLFAGRTHRRLAAQVRAAARRAAVPLTLPPPPDPPPALAPAIARRHVEALLDARVVQELRRPTPTTAWPSRTSRRG